MGKKNKSEEKGIRNIKIKKLYFLFLAGSTPAANSLSWWWREKEKLRLWGSSRCCSNFLVLRDV
jgi:hypothetical protein